eukprot:5964854-Amphidinium_carterae.1
MAMYAIMRLIRMRLIVLLTLSNSMSLSCLKTMTSVHGSSHLEFQIGMNESMSCIMVVMTTLKKWTLMSLSSQF